MKTPQKYDPVIAFATERISQIKKVPGRQITDEARIDELNMIVRLCVGMNLQEQMIADALGIRTEAA